MTTKPKANIEAKRFNSSFDDVELAYWLSRPASKSDRYLVLLHGGASNHTRWSEFISQTSLRENWNIIAPDMRGNAQSMTRTNLGIAQWCRDIADMLDVEGAQSAVLIGHSLGAHLALHFAASFSSKADGLVLIDPTLQKELKGYRRWTRRNPRLVKIIISIVLFLNSLGLRRKNFPIKNLQALDKETRKEIAQAESFDQIAERYSALGPILSALPLANYLRQCEAMVQRLPSLENISPHTLVLLSGATTMGDFEKNREQASKFSDVDVQILNANHWPLTEAPDETRDAIDSWVNRTWPF